MGVLTGEVAIVTGAGRGIGLAIAERYRSEGARVALLDLDAAAIAAAADRLGPAAVAVPVDVGDLGSVEAAVSAVISALGEVSILVNSAAAVTARATVERIDPSEWDRALRINLTGTFHMCRATLPSLRRRGGGCIVNVASQLGQVAVPGAAAYCATKGAVLQFTRALALDHAAEGIRVNSLSPGAVITERLIEVFGSEAAATASLGPNHPIGRLGVPREIAGAAVFLASQDASFMTGSDLVVDGGYTAR